MFDHLNLLSGSAERDHQLAGLFLGIFGLEFDGETSQDLHRGGSPVRKDRPGQWWRSRGSRRDDAEVGGFSGVEGDGEDDVAGRGGRGG